MIYVTCYRSCKPEKQTNGHTLVKSEPCVIPACAIRNHKRLGYQIQVQNPELNTPYDKPMWGDNEVWLAVNKAKNERLVGGLKLPQLGVGGVVPL